MATASTRTADMDEEELSERKLRLASILNRVRNMKSKYQMEEDTSNHSDHSDNSDIIRLHNCPEEWFSYLQKIEKKGDPEDDAVLRKRLSDMYSEAVAALPAEKYCRNESYAHILVRFAQLKVLEDQDDARDQFQLARLNCKTFAFVHVAFAQFELSRGNIKKSKIILQKAFEVSAVPVDMLKIALQNLLQKKSVLISEEDKENIPIPSVHETRDAVPDNGFKIPKNQDNSDSSSELPVHMTAFSLGADQKNDSAEEPDVIPRDHKPLMMPKSTASRTDQISSVRMPHVTPDVNISVHSRVPPDAGHGLKKSNTSYSSCNIQRQTSGSKIICSAMPSLSKPKKSGANTDSSLDLRSLKPLQTASPSEIQMLDDDQCSNDCTMKLLSKTKMKAPATFKEGAAEAAHGTSSVERNKMMESGQPKNCKNVEPSGKASSITGNQLKICTRISPEQAKRVQSEQPVPLPVPKRVPLHIAGTIDTNASVYETPSSKPVKDYMDCFRTPVVSNLPLIQHEQSSGCQHATTTPEMQFQKPSKLKVTSRTSNDKIVVKGKVYTILKQIGVGGSSKVFQVLDESKQLYAIKYVSFEEADDQTIESYQNEIAHLCRLQQHSDKIIRLYDYDISENRIYMVLECGNIDLNSWLRKKKNINPWERKSYWRNMLEAVHTIHQHGIIHSDLKPANFLIVDGMLKLIDFGIANQMQPDVTSIVKDSQVGTINFMPPEAIKDMSSYGENGKPRSKISPKSDVWSLGCILYCMTYGKTPFQHITNQITKLNAIIDPSYEIGFPQIPEKDLLDVLQRCLVRNPKERISIPELLVHPYVHIQAPPKPEQPDERVTEEMKRILGQLIGLNSPNSISRAAKGLYDQFSSGRSLDLSAFSKPSDQKAWQL
ncbi:dual specificity protein kinase TTK [Protopterus annectens]|uniref:dual specificity protein kinase TTK n=1 Tax=Protopterus annectens TaxID=7888 RepID=UPI001CFB779E|nr:dual specificity protein kinase TTK [Protopterus annectens]